jgi:hypothetical protein
MVKVLLLIALTALCVLLAVAAFAVAVPLFVRVVDRAFREQRRSSGASPGVFGAMAELDRFVRPSVEHVTEVQNAARLKRDDASGDA